MRKTLFAALATGAMLALAACSSGTYADVARFHSNQPIARGTLYIQPADAAYGNSLEFQTHRETVAVEMRRIGFQTVPTPEQAQFIATLGITQTDADVPAGRRTTPERTTTMTVQIKTSANVQPVWEGRATSTAAPNSSQANLTWAVPALATALFSGFPGTPGVTQQVRIAG